MKPRKTAYLAHRWLGLLVCVQLLAWSLGGFIFSVLSIESVRGELDMAASMYDPLAGEALLALPEPVRGSVERLDGDGDEAVGAVNLMDRGLGAFWEVRTVEGGLVGRLDPVTGAVMEIITPEEAIRIADRDFAPEAEVASVTLIEMDPPMEYRGGPLPSYRVDFEHAKNPHIYIDAANGQVRARRNTRWRVFDFFWMLHTMDYAERDDFNHPLLIGSSVVAILTASSGLTLWGWRAATRVGRRRGLRAGRVRRG
jgi:uncharacterized membrane protein YkoI